MDTVWKILSTAQAVHLLHHKNFDGSEDDKRDGFIHLSTLIQMRGTLDKHFEGQTGLYAVELATNALGDALRWEASRNGDFFPHLFRDFNIDDIVSIRPLNGSGSNQIFSYKTA
ncbi:DUF952 domain-containing protein [Acuticoccus sp. MNP-M23]|uniref:DUF952 domain-containing protein n=1 Tax=Acuticoccus sp. MNP-M23 TaxID=3072793 RepID=UPI0028163A07|nr:DUF952 domain-containing protein [Acuticoccus sp. MNP-M23]WMS44160.1 DUF952 domain-containing protein [Acuticoccus sp. MNP-M23]